MVKQIHSIRKTDGVFQVSWLEDDLEEWQGWHPANSADDNSNFEFATYNELIKFLSELGG